ncbi:MAG: T9SS type A sorting domain-containing protein [Bacteroidetes bacterium]|nr:T9SS type A sorting domain-containing protein [Bacteroidota bacterium]MCB9226274.1 T9SS type A sorting domain-containing protein [Chitinophagales bacterium]
MKQYLFFLACLFCAFSLKSQNVYIYKTDGSSEQYALNSVQRITYSGNNMILRMNNGATHTWDINTIDKYSYKELSPIIELNTPNFNFEVFPNSFENYLILKSNNSEVKGKFDIEIVDVSGKVFYSNEIGVEKMSDYKIEGLDDLVAGIYFCRITNSQSLFVKKIIKN